MREVSYNNIRLNTHVKVKRIKESMLPSLSSRTLTFRDSVGETFIKQNMGPRQFVIDFEIIANTLEKRQKVVDLLAPLLYVSEPKKLVIDKKRTYYAVVDGSTDIEEMRYDGAISLTFIAHDPIAYGKKIKSKIKNGEVKYNNAGNFKSKGQLNIKASSSKVTVRLSDGDEYDYISISNLKSGDNIVINMDKQSVTVNGNNRMYDVDPMGDFFSFPSGQFKLKFSGVSSGELSYYERWI